MAKQVLVYRCLLISPSDVDEERAAVVEVIEQWNATIGEFVGGRIDVVRWETHAVPDASAPPQEILNRQIVGECDFGIAIFWTRLGSPTTEHASGSIEEITQLLERGARVLVYMSSAPIPQERLIDDQYVRLGEFKNRLKDEGLLGTYRDASDLRGKLPFHVAKVIFDLMGKDRGQAPPPGVTGVQTAHTPGVLTAPKPDVRVVVYPAQTIPRTEGIDHLVGIRIQNHSPVVVFLSGISILLKSGHALLLYRDAVTGVEQSRVELRPGASLMWSANGDALLSDHAPDDYVGIIAYDDIGREYREPEGMLKTILQNWKDKAEK